MVRCVLVAAGLSSLVAPASVASALSEPTNRFVPDGPVSAVVRVEGRLVVGGAFRHIGPATGPLVRVDRATGRVVGGAPVVSGGSISALVGDGAGGWYVGGSFTRVDGVRRRGLAHVLADGSIAAGFDPAPTLHDGARPDPAQISAVALAGGWLYIVGLFDAVGGVARSNLAAIDPVTGEAAPGRADALGSVEGLAAVGGTVYVAGDFYEIGGQARAGLAALDAATTSVLGWDPAANGRVRALASDGSRLYAGGDFTRIGGAERPGLAALDPATGLDAGWTPEVPQGRVTALAASSETVDAVLASTPDVFKPADVVFDLDRTTGRRRWQIPTDGHVATLFHDQGRLLVGGTYNGIGGQLRDNVAALTAAGGVDGWRPAPHRQPSPGDLASTVTALGGDANGVLVAGSFVTVGGVSRDGLAALDPTSGDPTPWRPRLDGDVTAITRSQGRFYAVGSFRVVDGRRRAGAAAFDTQGRLTRWRTPPLNGATAYGVAVAGTRVILYGFFNGVGKTIKHGSLAAFDARSGALLGNWGPPDLVGDGVQQLLVDGDRIFAVGLLRDGLTSTVVVLDAATGRVIRRPVSNRNVGDVASVALRGRTLYLAGAFTRINGIARQYLAAIDLPTGRVLPWSPRIDQNADAIVLAGDTIFVSGQFSHAQGARRTGVAAFSVTSGALRTFNPGVTSFDTNVAAEGNELILYGAFAGLSTGPQGNLAIVRRHPG